MNSITRKRRARIGRRSPRIATMLRAGKPTTVNQLCDLYQVHANEYYQQETKAGQRIPTGHATCMHYAMVPLRAVAGNKAPMDLQAEDLYAAQQWMLNRGLSRTEITTAPTGPGRSSAGRPNRPAAG